MAGGIDTADLRNCPFCGCRPEVQTVPSETHDHNVFVVECQNMGCIMPRSRGRATRDELVREWNGVLPNGGGA